MLDKSLQQTTFYQKFTLWQYNKKLVKEFTQQQNQSCIPVQLVPILSILLLLRKNIVFGKISNSFSAM